MVLFQQAKASAELRPAAGGQNKSLAVLLGQLALATTTPLLLIIAYFVITDARRQRASDITSAQDVAMQVSQLVDREVERAMIAAQTLATSRMLADGDFVGFDSQVREVAKLLGNVIAVRKPDGQQVLNTSNVLGSPLPQSSEAVRQLDRLAAETRAPVISDLVVGAVLKRPLIIVVVPIMRNGDTKYFINVAILSDKLAELLVTAERPGWTIALVGQDGRVIARSRAHETFVGKSANADFLKVATGVAGTWRGLTLDEIPIVGAYVRSSISHWRVAVAVPESILSAPSHSALKLIVTIVALAWSLTVLLAWLFSRRIVKPIAALVTQSRILGEGKISRGIKTDIKEINEVMAQLNRSSAEVVQRERAMRLTDDRYRSALTVGRMGSWETNLVTGVRLWSPEAIALFGLEIKDGLGTVGTDEDEFVSTIHPEDRHLVKKFYAVAQTEDAFPAEYRIVHSSGKIIWLAGRGQVIERGPRGEPQRILSIMTDITERKMSEEHIRDLMNEISHRSQNLLTVVGAISRQLSRDVVSINQFQERFDSRLSGLAKSYEVLVNQNWKSAPLASLVRQQLAPFVDSADRRIELTGPDVRVNATAAQAIGMAIHELATNAVKYGALSSSTGQISVEWTFKSNDHASNLWLTWQESGGPVVNPPTRKGFGHKVMEKIVPMFIDGTAVAKYDPSGLQWVISIPRGLLQTQATN